METAGFWGGVGTEGLEGTMEDSMAFVQDCHVGLLGWGIEPKLGTFS